MSELLRILEAVKVSQPSHALNGAWISSTVLYEIIDKLTMYEACERRAKEQEFTRDGEPVFGSASARHSYYQDLRDLEDFRDRIEKLEEALDHEGKMREQAVAAQVALRERAEEAEDRVEELATKLEDVHEKFNAPCGDALDRLWKEVMPATYGDWEYPGMAYRHLRAEFDDRNKRIKYLEGQLDIANRHLRHGNHGNSGKW